MLLRAYCPNILCLFGSIVDSDNDVFNVFTSKKLSMFHFDFDFLKIFAHQGCLDRYSKWQVFAIQSIMQTLDIKLVSMKLNYIGVIGFLFPQMRSHSGQISISRLFAMSVKIFALFFLLKNNTYLIRTYSNLLTFLWNKWMQNFKFWLEFLKYKVI